MVSLLFREMLGGAMRVKITIAASVPTKPELTE